MFDDQKQLFKLKPSNDPYAERRVWMSELPNPLLNKTWDTPDINSTLTEAHSVRLSENGDWCFDAASGLWRIWPELSPEEVERGVSFH